jgi:hypothetical protein
MCSQLDLWLDPTCGCPLSSLRRVLFVSSWRGPETNEKHPNLRLLGLSLTSCAYHAFFAECLPWPCVNRLQLCLAWSVLYSLMVHPLFSFATLLTPRTPLNREGALVLRLRSRRIPSKLGLYNYIRLYTNIRGIVPRHAKYNIHQLYTNIVELYANIILGTIVPEGFPILVWWPYPINADKHPMELDNLTLARPWERIQQQNFCAHLVSGYSDNTHFIPRYTLVMYVHIYVYMYICIYVYTYI